MVHETAHVDSKQHAAMILTAFESNMLPAAMFQHNLCISVMLHVVV